MAKVIRTVGAKNSKTGAKKPRPKRSFKEGEVVKWSTVEMFRPGGYEFVTWSGMIIKVRPTTVHCITNKGDVWSVNKKEVYVM